MSDIAYQANRNRISYLLANLDCQSSLRRPPDLIDVFSKGVERNVTWSDPDNRSCKTCVWYKPCTGSPLICVIKSPGRKPASKAGLPFSTAWKWN